MEAYRAYGGDLYIQKALTLWSNIQAIQITQTDVEQGRHDGMQFQSTCSGRAQTVILWT
jgi:hypothetical protein